MQATLAEAYEILTLVSLLIPVGADLSDFDFGNEPGLLIEATCPPQYIELHCSYLEPFHVGGCI